MCEHPLSAGFPPLVRWSKGCLRGTPLQAAAAERLERGPRAREGAAAGLAPRPGLRAGRDERAPPPPRPQTRKFGRAKARKGTAGRRGRGDESWPGAELPSGRRGAAGSRGQSAQDAPGAAKLSLPPEVLGAGEDARGRLLGGSRDRSRGRPRGPRRPAARRPHPHPHLGGRDRGAWPALTWL